MLYKETVTPSTLELLRKLMDDPELQDFVLVGGTSLALQIGHRVSVDLDLFSIHSFVETDLNQYLIDQYHFETDFLARSTVKGEIEGVQIDCLSHAYPLVGETNMYENIRLASIQDIAAMKLNAISGNGTRIKDFIDIAYLAEYMSLNEMLASYQSKYKTMNVLIPVKALTYFDEINFDEPIKMLSSKKFNWKKIENRIYQMLKMPQHTFPRL